MTFQEQIKIAESITNCIFWFSILFIAIRFHDLCNDISHIRQILEDGDLNEVEEKE